MLEKFCLNEKIELRIIQDDDFKDLFNLIDKNRLFLTKWLPWVDFTNTESDSKAFIDISKQDFKNKKSIQYAIIYENNLVGMFGLNEINMRNKSVSFGYWLGEQYQGKGIITSVCEYIKNYIFLNENIHRIEIRADEGNIKSRSIPERLNFKLEGILKDADWIDGHYENVCIYSLINEY